MNRIGSISSIGGAALFIAAALGAPDVAAQPFERLLRRNFWNDGSNVTGMRTDSIGASYAEAYGRIVHGGFRDSYEADEAWSSGIAARTVMHRQRISMSGGFSFDRTSGRGMSGSMFCEPGFYPIDALEFTPGRKDRQTYAFDGAIAADVSECWRIGAGIDFESSNYAKRKDLRHTNYRLDLTVSPGAMWHRGDGAIGVNYLFGKNSESIKAEEVGSAAAAYYAFLDKGLMYGSYEAWTGSGTHLSESGIDGLPVREILHGVALQGSWRNLYADIEYRHGAGVAGEKRTEWFRFPSHRITAHAAYGFGSRERMQHIRLRVEWRRQTNDETVLDKETSNGITNTFVYGQNRIFERETFCVNPEYEWIDARNELRIGAEVESIERLSSQMYPYLFFHSTIRSRVYMSGRAGIGKFEIGLGGWFLTGNATEDSRCVDDVEAGDTPYHLTEYYDLQNEYLTASRLGLEASVRYKFRCGVYAEAEASYVRGFRLKYIAGANRWCETIKIGYDF